VRDTLADAAERPQAAKPAAAEHDQVGIRGRLEQRGNRLRLLETSSSPLSAQRSASPIARGKAAASPGGRAIRTEQGASRSMRVATLPIAIPTPARAASIACSGTPRAASSRTKPTPVAVMNRSG
jgi:hypothetical protein